jgi:hypothetical protein
MAHDTSTTSSTTAVWYRWATSEPARRTSNQYRQRERSTSTISKREKERKAAEAKAKQLLLDLIGKEDLDIYNETGRLFVKGKKYDYIIQKEGFIKRVEKKKITDLCVHLDNRYKYPSTDNVIAMKLAIEADEAQVLKLANNHGSSKRPKTLPRAACM